jgi:hypothetical protein
MSGHAGKKALPWMPILSGEAFDGAVIPYRPASSDVDNVLQLTATK